MNRKKKLIGWQIKLNQVKLNENQNEAKFQSKLILKKELFEF